jgi:4'-phosphopantetheinyl transferase
MFPAKATDHGVQVWVATVAEADLTLRAWLDHRELERLDGYQGDADRARFLLGAAMVRSAVGSRLGMHPRAVPVHRGCADCGRWHGRPVVPDPRLALSVSHGGLLVALALAVGCAVGVDVERIDGRRREDVRRWTREEARWKAGAPQPRLAVRELMGPLPGHVLTLATEQEATVELLPARDVLARDP